MAKQIGDGRIKTKRKDLAKIYIFIACHPGCKVRAIADSLGINYSQVLSRLVAMERVGLLLSEDIKRRLWIYSCEGFNDYQSVWR